MSGHRSKKIGVFTTIMIRNGKPLFLHSHLSRLQHNSSVIGINVKIQWLEDKIRIEIQDRNPQDIALKVILYQQTELQFIYRDLPIRSNVTAKIVMECSNSELPRNIKHTDRDSWKTEQKIYGVDELLWVNNKNQALEFSNGNIFVLREGKLITPIRNGYFLPGIMRSATIIYGGQIGIPIYQKNIEIQSQDELYFSSSLRGLIPVSIEQQNNPDSLKGFREGLWQILHNHMFQNAVTKEFITQSLK
jgi:branched-subunit amino acid aminotransferase/4-amino-4-deoxychorismate lyase